MNEMNQMNEMDEMNEANVMRHVDTANEVMKSQYVVRSREEL